MSFSFPLVILKAITKKMRRDAAGRGRTFHKRQLAKRRREGRRKERGRKRKDKRDEGRAERPTPP